MSYEAKMLEAAIAWHQAQVERHQKLIDLLVRLRDVIEERGERDG